MATLDALKLALRQQATAITSSPTQPLTNTQYSAGFNTFIRGPGWASYQDFIIPKLSQLLNPLFNSRIRISVLEVGPGPKTILGHLPYSQRRKVTKYAAFEPNSLFATTLEGSLGFFASEPDAHPLPGLESPPDIRRTAFAPRDSNTEEEEKFDVVLFCHSMYGMKSQTQVRRARAGHAR